MFECIGLVSARALALHQFQRSAVIGGTVCLLAPLIIYIWPGVGTLGPLSPNTKHALWANLSIVLQYFLNEKWKFFVPIQLKI
jgi:hypothetical protein